MRDLAEAAAVIVVDDAGDADAESLRFLGDLLGDLTAMPIVLIFAANQRGTLRRPWLETLATHELNPLPEDALRKLVATATEGLQGVDEASIVRLIEHAQVRPGTLLAELEAATKGGAIVEANGVLSLAPTAMAELLDKGRLKARHGGRFDAIGEEELLVARLGAVFGARFWLGGVAALLRSGG